MTYTYMPASTITVQSTVTKTTFVTVRRSGEGSQQMSTSLILPSTSSSEPALPTSTSATALASEDTTEKTTTTSSLPLPTTQPAPAAPTTTVSVTTELAPITTTAIPESQDATDSRRHAIIGGLSGSIAGLLLIGGLFFFFMRRRRQRWQELDATGEKGDTDAAAHRWTAIMHRHPRNQPSREETDRQSTAASVEQDHLIRINTNSWSRPYVRGQGEGIRDSYPSTVLRVMNPDQTQDGYSARTATPVRRTGTLDSGTTSPGTFLRKQRSALVAALYADNSRNGSAVDVSSTQNRPRPLPPIPPPPVMTIHRVPSHASSIRAPSMRSSLSASSHPIVTQHPLEDPFRTESIRSRSSLGQSQGAVYHTLDRVNNMLDSLRARQNIPRRARPPSQRSVSTLGSSGYSDPFDLDNRSPLTPQYRSYDVR